MRHYVDPLAMVKLFMFMKNACPFMKNYLDLEFWDYCIHVDSLFVH